MKKFFISTLSLLLLLIISVLIYTAWIVNKGEFQSEYLSEFINDKFKKEGLFYTTSQNPTLRFDKSSKRIIIDSEKLKIFTNDEKNIANFENFKVFINFLSLIRNKKLEANKVTFQNGDLDLPNIFSKKLSINQIVLEGDLLNKEEITLSNFLASINEDLYEGSAVIDLNQFSANGTLNLINRKKLFYGKDLVSNNLNFSVNSEKFLIEGPAQISDVEVSLTGEKKYKDHTKYKSKYNIKTTLDQDIIKQSLNVDLSSYIEGDMDVTATYFIYQNNSEKIKTDIDFLNNEINFPLLNLIKEKNIKANGKVDFNFSKNKLNNINILEYKEGDKNLKGLIEFDPKFSPYKSVELSLTASSKSLDIKFIRNTPNNKLTLKGDFFDFSDDLKNFANNEKNEDSFLKKFQPIDVNLNAKEILISEKESIYKVQSLFTYQNNLIKTMKLNSALNDNSTFKMTIGPKGPSREVVINSNDAGLLMKKFNINKSGKGGEFSLYGLYDDSKDTHPLDSKVTIRDMRLIKAPVLAKILNLASIGIVSALSGEGILISKLKSEFILEDGVLSLNKYEAYGPDIGFSNKGKIYLKKKELDLEGALVPMVTLNKIVGSIPVLGKILTNERKGIWSFIYTIKGDIKDPNVHVNPIKTITPGFIKKFFSIFKDEEEKKKN